MEQDYNKKGYYIKYVAIYIRKSRGDLDKDLEKHKKVLIELCVQNNWKYVLYEEIESGDSIAIRPIMQKLLKDVEDGVYDAVLVIDIDRLGRGDMGDQDVIKKIFTKSETLIITDKGMYNLNNEDDEFFIDMKSFIARQEYKQIVKRLVRGKKIGSRLGNWTNGKPPYPYEYEKWKEKYNEKGLVINDEKYEIYRFIIDSIIIHQIPPNDIAWELNKKKISAPRGGIWHGSVITRILVDETQLGKIISNKTQGDGHTKKKPNAKEVKKIPKSEWVIIENCHEAVKTQEEHEKILVFLSRDKKTPKRSVAKKLPLTGLIRCGKCEYGLGVQERTERNNNVVIKTCWYHDMYGNKCGNKGGSIDIVYEYLNIALAEYEKQLEENLNKHDNIDNKEIELLIQKQIKLIKTKEKSIKKIQEAYELDVYNINEYKERKNEVTLEIDELTSELKVMELKLKYTNESINENKLFTIQQFKDVISKPNISNEELNDAYKSIIESIIWTRTDKDNVSVKVNFK